MWSIWGTWSSRHYHWWCAFTFKFLLTICHCCHVSCLTASFYCFSVELSFALQLWEFFVYSGYETFQLQALKPVHDLVLEHTYKNIDMYSTYRCICECTCKWLFSLGNSMSLKGLKLKEISRDNSVYISFPPPILEQLECLSRAVLLRELIVTDSLAL